MYDLPKFTEPVNCSTIDPELFFVADWKSAHKEREVAKSICASCPSATACFEYALTHNVEGVWAGTTTRERKIMRKQLNIIVEDDSITD